MNWHEIRASPAKFLTGCVVYVKWISKSNGPMWKSEETGNPKSSSALTSKNRKLAHKTFEHPTVPWKETLLLVYFRKWENLPRQKPGARRLRSRQQQRMLHRKWLTLTTISHHSLSSWRSWHVPDFCLYTLSATSLRLEGTLVEIQTKLFWCVWFGNFPLMLIPLLSIDMTVKIYLSKRWSFSHFQSVETSQTDIYKFASLLQ